MKTLAVLGAGSWGTALSIVLAPRFERVHLWARDGARARELQASRQNMRHLPGFVLPPVVTVSSDMDAAVATADLVLTAVPSAHFRTVMETAAPAVAESAIVLSATKGIEGETLCRMSEVIGATVRTKLVAVLSGPTFAREIAASEPAAVVIASDDCNCAERIQEALVTPTVRLYTSTDVIGVEMGAAIKNVIALGAGICRGLGLGSNSVAALITRGLAEITRLAVAMGGEARTLSGLAGLGDLVLTATGDLSRNRRVGIELGRGRKLPDVLGEMNEVAEGVSTCRASFRLGQKHDVDMPIVGRMYEVLYEGKEPRQAIRELMERPLGSE